ncbi:MAG TPA: hypothetical protein VK589_29930 [Chryseolinea sp.]|nr:hypothetical protein [Chryseolinea sp.]
MTLKSGTVFMTTLTHDGKLDYLMAKAFYMTPSQERLTFYMPRQTSLLAAGYNHLWCQALNLPQKHDLRWFAMLHSDIVPEDFWVDKLIAEAEKHDADVMSAIVPIKENSGVTSTAISGPDNFTRFARLTMKQVYHPSMPDTFGIRELLAGRAFNVDADLSDSRLLVNTGCFVCRVDREWCGRVHFTINDRVSQQLGGAFAYAVEPEDWYFSRRVAEEGGKVMATKVVKLEHIGSRSYKSNEVWGDEMDPATLTM